MPGERRPGDAVAEKLEAGVRLGEANIRMKDFFDLWFLRRKFPLESDLVIDAIIQTFARRKMPLLATGPVALTPDFAALKTPLGQSLPVAMLSRR